MRHLLPFRPHLNTKTLVAASLSMVLIFGQATPALATDSAPPPAETQSATPPQPESNVQTTSDAPQQTTSETSDQTPPANSSETETTTEATVTTTTQTDSHSGDSEVSQNTTAGSAATGNALGSATVVNTVNSNLSTNPSQPIDTFVKNILGGSNGDIVIDPSKLLTGSSPLLLDEQSVKNNATLAIKNDLSVNATSGDATVRTNTTAGDATTGKAVAAANIINSLSSTVSSLGSFIGVINIAGDFAGDILLPESMMKNLYLAAGKVTDLRSTTTVGITNDINAGAESGAATVASNTTGGKATTGDATTQVSVLDIVSQNIQADRALLVFVNVLGKWTGVMWQPATNSSGPQPVITAQETDIENTLDAQIHNNIDVAARSGDARVTNNTTAGNATSGDAGAHVNLLNMVNASFQVSDWFGVLFINILGNWNGNLGVNAQPATPGRPAPAKKPIPVTSSPHRPAGGTASLPPEDQSPRFTAVTTWSKDFGAPATLAALTSSATDQASRDTIGVAATGSSNGNDSSPPPSAPTTSAVTGSPLLNTFGMLSLVAAFGGLRLLRPGQSGSEL